MFDKVDYNKQWLEENPDYHKQWYKNNKEKVKIQHKQYLEDNRDKRNEYEREYYQKNKDKIKAKKREYRSYYCRKYPDKVKISLKKFYLNNKDTIRDKQREYYKDNAEKIRETSRRWIEENPEKNREIKSRYRARKNGAKGYITSDEFIDICEQQNWLCAYCGEPKPLAMEHTQPLSRGGSHEASNIVGSCKRCNSEKHNSTLEEFLDRIGLTTDQFKNYAPSYYVSNIKEIIMCVCGEGDICIYHSKVVKNYQIMWKIIRNVNDGKIIESIPYIYE